MKPTSNHFLLGVIFGVGISLISFNIHRLSYEYDGLSLGLLLNNKQNYYWSNNNNNKPEEVEEDEEEEAKLDNFNNNNENGNTVINSMVIPFEEDDNSSLLLLEDEEQTNLSSIIVDRDEEEDDLMLQNNVAISWEMVPAKYKINQTEIIRQKRLARKLGIRGPKFFTYNPSGGYGNQRYQIRWAIIAANAMNRTLILPAISPHSSMWYGYNKWRGEDLVPASQVLDMRALSRVVKRGVLTHNDTLSSLREYYLKNLSFWEYEKKYEGYWSYGKIEKLFLDSKVDVLVWKKHSIWTCCGAVAKWKEFYARHIFFNQHLKMLSKTLIESVLPAGVREYNAVHVRRGDHTMHDRKSPSEYFKHHSLHLYERALPIYVATDEPDRKWFSLWERRKQYRRYFSKLIFWSDLPQNLIRLELKNYPKAMHRDILGFLEILISSRAKRWEGSDKSTFSMAIYYTRKYPEARIISTNLSLPRFPNVKLE